MQITVDIEIASSKEKVWATIIDIENCASFIASIVDLQILNKPEDSLVGLKWKETRVMFGKEASETMWITDSVEKKYYRTRAESHGSVYITKLSLSAFKGKTILTMSFSAEAQTTFVKILSLIMGMVITSSMKKALRKDLEDIKKQVEKS